MNMLYEQSLDLREDDPSLEERIDGQLYEPTLDGVSLAEFDLKWIGELVSAKRAELGEARQRFTVTSDPEARQIVELSEWELEALVQRQVALRQFLPRLRKLYQAAVEREFQPLGEDEEERGPASVESIFSEEG